MTPHDDDYLLAGDTGNAKKTKKGNRTDASQINASTYGATSERSESSMPPLPAREGVPRASRSSLGGTVSVTHSFVMRNHIEDNAKSYTPAYQIQWGFTITLAKGTGQWLGVAMEQPRVLVVKSNNKLQKLRIVRLNDAVFNAFGVELEFVDALAIER